MCKAVAWRLLIEPTIPCPLGTAVVSRKGAHDNVAAELSALTVLPYSPLPCDGFKGSIAHSRPPAPGGACVPAPRSITHEPPEESVDQPLLVNRQPPSVHH
uniref:Uncharacterized protein n=1 Tax=Eutreptiella gymnastica TaxID=73025 RepID=A0A7S4FF87_9EUGL